MRSARPSAMAVLPTPGSPISTGLFFVRRDRTWIVRRISSSRPITGSSLPSRATSVRSRAYFFSASYWFSADAESAVRPLRRSSMAPFSACGLTPGIGEDLSGLGRLVHRQREQQPLDRDEGIAGLLRDLLGRIEEPRRRRREIELPGARALHARQFLQRDLGLDQRLARPSARAIDQARRQPFRVVEQNLQHMFGGELLVPFADGQRLRGLDEATRALGIVLEIHSDPPAVDPSRSDRRRRDICAPAPEGDRLSQIWEGFAQTKVAETTVPATF